MTDSTALIQGALLLLGGLVLCFRGRALFRMLLPLVGFVLCAFLAVGIAKPYAHGDVLYLGGAALVGGVIGAIFAFVAYLYGLFVVGSTFGAHMGAVLATRYGWDMHVTMLVLGLTGGIAAVLVERLIVILATSIWGGMFVVAGYLVLTGQATAERLVDPAVLVQMGHRPDLVPLAWLGLAIGGIVIQSLPERVVVVR